MKILAIRGRNLASLSGDFELDFTSEPLFGSGLFAITGETGAGKSTILDTLCLALYGDFPRITGKGHMDRVETVRGETLQTSDPRSILRTGCAEAYAQVDLEIGNERLQASWQVRRARNKADGTLQKFERGLVDLAGGKVVASGKTKVDREITDRLKLNYDQFRRTVLLAQNDFDAFLRANDSERADLLEKITGTELYSKLSIKAHETEREALTILENLRQKSGFIEVLAGDERRSLEENVEQIETERSTLAEKSNRSRSVVDWYKKRDELQARLAAAELSYKQASEELEANKGQKDLLAKLEKVQSVQAFIERAAEKKSYHEQLLEEQAGLKQQRDLLTSRLQEADRRLQITGAQFDEANKALIEAAPRFELATELDAKIDTSSGRLNELQAAHDKEKKEQATLEKRHVDFDRQVRKLDARIDKLKNSLLLRQAIESVAKRGAELGRQFARLAEQQRALIAAEKTLASQENQFKQLMRLLESEQSATTERQVLLAKNKERYASKAQMLADLQPDKVRRTCDGLTAYQNKLSILAPQLEQAVEQQALIERTAKMQTTAEASVQMTTRELQQLEDQLRDLKARKTETSELLLRSQTISSPNVLQLRADLVEGEACPVCGSSDHPGHDDETLGRLLEEMRARKSELAQTIEDNEQQRGLMQQRLEEAKGQRESAKSQQQAARKRLASLETDTARRLAQTKELAQPLGFEIAAFKGLQQQLAQIIDLQTENERDVLQARKQLEAVQQLETESQRLSKHIAELEKKNLAEDERGRDLETRWQDAREKLAKTGNVLEHQREVHDLALGQLLSELGGVDVSRADIERDPKGAETFVQGEIASYNNDQDELANLTEKRVRQQGELAVLLERTTQKSLHTARVSDELSQVRKTLAAHQRERAKLFAGRSLKEVRLQMEEKQGKAGSALHEANTLKTETGTRLEELEKNLAKLAASVKKAISLSDRATKAQNEALRQKGLDLDEAQTLLAIESQKRNEIARQSARLEENHSRSRALLADRKQHLDELEKLQPQDLTREQASEQLKDLEASMAMVLEELGKIKSRLELDDKALKHRKKIAGRIEEVESRHARWAAVSGAIGSKDGARFRRFAQGVTLDHLIALANQQLRNINPRYEIERSTIGGLGLQVVDVEMGGEIRSVRSLSGGERFLVSLALALALSQLDGRASFVDTLMIDEGFGALDARSLDMAVEALECLQSQGRKVGVISHIEALTDRIPVQVRVEKQGNGRSRVRIVDRGLEQNFA